MQARRRSIPSTFAQGSLVLGLLLALAFAALAPQPVAAQGAPITPQSPCRGGLELTSRTVASPGVQNLRGIANQPVVNRTGTQVAFWSTNDLIAGRNLDGNIEVFYRNLGAEQPTQLTDSLGSILGGFNLNPSISADGNRVTFFSDRDLVPGRNVNGNFEIFLATRAANGTWSIRQLTDTQVGANLFPSISSDGTRIAFVSDEADLHNVDGSRSNPERSFQIFLATVGAGEQVSFRQITQTGMGVTNDEPVISGDGTRIAWTQSGGQGAQIYLWDAATPNATVRLTEGANNDQPSINADGTRIAYVSTNTAGRSRIVLYSAGDAQQGDRTTVIVPQSQSIQYRSPSISDNGQRVVYVAETATSAGPAVEVYLYDTTVHSQGGVPVTAGSSEQPAISGDGAHIVFVRLTSDTANEEDVSSQIIMIDCPLADLVLQPITPLPASVLAGIDLVYTFRLTNNGPSVAEAARVTLQDIARPNLVTLSAELSDPRCSITAGGMTCAFGDLAPGASTEFSVAWDVPANAGLDDIRSRLIAASNAIDPHPDRADTGVLTTRVSEVANLVLTKSGSADTIQAGASTPFFYTLTLENLGPSRARDTVVIDTLPNNVQIVGNIPLSSYIVQAADPNAACTIAQPNRIVRCELGSVPADTTTIIRIPIVALPNAPAQLTNSAVVQSETEDLTPDTRQASLSTAVFRPAILRVTKTADPVGEVIAGNRLTYTVTIENLGTANTVNVSLTDLLPPNVTWVNSEANSPECASQADGTVVACQFTPLNVGNNRILTYVTQVASTAPGGMITNTVTALSARPDPDGTQNTGSVSHEVILESDLNITKTASTLTPDINEPYTYTLRIRNDGPSQATGVVVSEPLRTGITHQGNTPSLGSYNPNTGIWTLGAPLAVGAEAELQIRVTAGQNRGGQNVTNTATVSSDNIDPNPANNTASVTVIPQRANLILTKQAGPTPVVAGATLRYTLTVTNQGPSTARNAVLVDTLPPGAEFLAANTIAGGGSCTPSGGSGGTVTCQAGNILDQGSRVYEIQIRYTVAEPIFNTATVTSDTPERTQDLANNTASITVTVIPAAPHALTFERQPPTPTTAGLGQDPPPIVAIRDQFGNITNVGDDATLTVRLRATTGVTCGSFPSFSSIQPLTGNTIAAVNGQATFTGIIMRKAATNYRWRADIEGLPNVTNACSDIFVVNPAAPSQLVYLTSGQTITASTTLLSGPITVQRRDQFGNPNTAALATTINLATSPAHAGTGFFSNAAGSNVSSLSSISIAQGSSQATATFRYRDTLAGTATLTASATGLTPAVQPILIRPAPTSQLVFTAYPSSVVAGEFSGIFRVERRDPFNNVNNLEGALTVSLATTALPATASFRQWDVPTNEITSVTIPAQGSFAQFRYQDTRAAAPTLTASAANITPAQQAITVQAAAATKLVFTTATQTQVVAGQLSGLVTVQRQDPFNNPNSSDGPVIVLLDVTAGPEGFLNNQFRSSITPATAITQVQIAQGSHSASFFYIDQRAGTKTITVKDQANALASASQPITIVAAISHRLRFTTDPKTIVANPTPLLTGLPDQIQVVREDFFGNPNSSDPELIVQLNNVYDTGDFFDTSGTLVLNSRRVTISPPSSTANFLYSDQYAGGRTIAAVWFSGGGVGSLEAASQQMTVVAADATQLQFMPADTTIQAGTESNPITVIRRDVFGNPADQQGPINVTLTTSSGPGIFRETSFGPTVGSVLIPDKTAATTFVYSDTLQGTHNITGTYTGLSAATGTVTVNSAPANQLVFLTAPRTITAGQVSQVVTIQRQDTFGNPADQDGALTLGLATDSGTGAFVEDANQPGVTTTSVGMGLNVPSASFYFTDTIAGNYAITVTGNLPGDPTAFASQAITITPDGAFKLVFTTPVYTNTVAGINSPPMTVQRQDQFGNVNLADPDVGLTLSSSVPVSATFLLTDGVTSLAPSNVITIAQGTSDTSFLYNNRRVAPGTHVITAQGDLPQTLGAFVNQDHVIVPAAPDYIQLRSAGPYTVTAGITRTLVITAFDEFDNQAVDYTGVQTLNFGGAPVSLTGNFTPNVTDRDGVARTLGLAVDSPLSQDVALDFVDGVAQTDTISRGIMTLYRAGVFTITARAQANAPFVQLDAAGGNALHILVDQAEREKFQVQDAPSDQGAPIPDQDLRSGTTVQLYVAASDAFGNGLPDQLIEVLQWIKVDETPSVFGTEVITVSPLSGFDFTNVTGIVSGTVRLKAVIDLGIDGTEETEPTGVITVVPGDVASVSVETAPAALTPQLVAAQTISSSASITVHAVLRDAVGNRVSVAEDSTTVQWALVNKTDQVEDKDLVPDAAPARRAVFTGDKVGTAVIRASIPISGSLVITPSGTITVEAGSPAGIEIRREGDGASNITVAAGVETSIVITMYDSSGNKIHNFSGPQDVFFFGSTVAPDNVTNPTVTRRSNGLAIPFGSLTSMQFNQGVMTPAPTGQGRMRLYNAGPSQIITATVSTSSGPVGVRTLPTSGHLTVNVVHAGLDTFDLSLSAPQTNTLPFTPANTLTALDLYKNPVLNFSPAVTPVVFTADLGTVGFSEQGGSNTLSSIVPDAVSNGVVNLTAYGMVYTSMVYTGTGIPTANTNVTFSANSSTPAAAGGATIYVHGGPAQTLVVVGGLVDPWPAGTGLLNFEARDGQGNYSPGYAGTRTLRFGKSGPIWPTFPPYVVDNQTISQTFGLDTPLTFNALGQTGFVPVMGLFRAQPDVTVTFTDTVPPLGAALTLTGSFTVDVVAAALDRFEFILEPSQTVGAVFSGTNTLEPLDVYGNRAVLQPAELPVTVAASSGGTVTFTQGTNNNTLSATSFITTGVADLTEQGMVYVGSTGSVTFTATSNAPSSKMGVSNPVTFASDTPARLVLTGPGSPRVAGEPFTLTIQALDVAGNLANAYATTVALEIGGTAQNSPKGDAPEAGGEIFGEGLNIQFNGGVATVTDVILVATQTGAVISATFVAGPFDGVTSHPLGNYTTDVVAGPAEELFIQTPPGASQTAGEALLPNPAVHIRDGFGNLHVDDSSSVVTATVDGPAAFTAGSAITKTASGGVTVFDTLILTRTGLYTLTFISDATPTPSTQVTFTVGAAQPNALDLTGPDEVVAGVTSDDFILTVFDVYGNTAPVTTTTTLNLSADSGGTITFTPSALTLNVGVDSAVFTYADTEAGVRTVTAMVSSGNLMSATASHVLTVTPGAPAVIDLTGPITMSAGAASEPFTVTVKDVFGNLAPVAVATEVTPSTSGGVSPSFAPDPAVIAIGAFSTTFAYTDLGTGFRTITATVTDGPASLLNALDTHVIEVLPGPPAALVIQTQPNATQTAGAPLAPPIVVELVDSLGNVVAGENTATITATVAGGFNGGVTTKPFSSGVASFGDLVLNTANVYSVTFSTSAGAFVTNTIDFTVLAGAPASLVLVDGDNQVGQVAQPLAAPLRVRLFDVFTNPIAGAVVTFTVPLGDGTFAGASNELTTTTSVTGLATSTLWTLGTEAKTYTATAVAAGLPGMPVSFPATGIPGPAANIAIFGGNSQLATVGEPVADPLVTRVTDLYGNPLAGASVTYTVTAGGGSFPGPLTTVMTTTDSAGLAYAPPWTLGTTAGLNEVDVSSYPLPFTLTFTATALVGDATYFTIVDGNGQTSTVNEELPLPLSVSVTDVYANPIAGQSIQFQVGANSGAFEGLVTSVVTTTSASGVATSTLWTLGTLAGQQTVTATVQGGPLAGATVVFTATANPDVAAIFAIFDGNGQPATVGEPVADPLVTRVTDAYGNPIAGASVAYSVTVGGGSFPGPLTTVMTTTDSAGLAYAPPWTLGTTPGLNEVDATSYPLPDTLTFTATALVGDATYFTIEDGNGQIGTVNEELPLPLQVSVTDVYSNPIAGQSIQFQVGANSGTFENLATSVVTTTSASGVATSTLWTLGTLAGQQTVTATVQGGPLAGASVIFTATANPGAPIVIELTGPDDVAVGVFSEPFTVTVKDAFGNLAPVAVATEVTPSTSGGVSPSFAPFPAVIAIGAFSTTFTYTDLGTGFRTITATVTDGPASLLNALDTHVIEVLPGPPAALVIQTQPNVTQTAGAPLAPPIVVELVDSLGNVVAGENTATITATVAGDFDGGVTTKPFSSGVASFGDLVLNTANVYSVTFSTSAGAFVTNTIDFTVLAGAPASLVLVDGDNQVGQVAQPLAAPLRVRLFDAYANPIAGAVVTFTVPLGDGTFAGATNELTTTTSVTGLATSTLWTLGTEAKAYTATAVAAGLPGMPVLFPATANPGAITQMVIDVQPSDVVTDTAISPSPQVSLRDTFGNVATYENTATITATIASGPSTGFTLGSTDVVTVVAGVAVFSNLALPDAGSHTLQFSTNVPLVSPVTSISFNITAPPPP